MIETKLTNGNYEIDLETGIAKFDIFNKDNISNLMLMWLATHTLEKEDKK